ncbi:hypothetical protein Tco_1142642 [Tanacetum coccineum]
MRFSLKTTALAANPESTSYFDQGAYDHEADSSRPKRTRQYETIEEAILPRVHHEFLRWGTSNRASKTKYYTNLARLLPKQIYSPCIVDWGVLNNMGCGQKRLMQCLK